MKLLKAMKVFFFGEKPRAVENTRAAKVTRSEYRAAARKFI